MTMLAVQYAIVPIAAFFALLPLIWSWRFNRHIRWPGNVLSGRNAWPEVAVVLPLRGADPSIEHCLAGLLHQNYPSYSVHIVIDSADPLGESCRPCWRVSQRTARHSVSNC